VKARSKREKRELVRIQEVAELRFAAEFAPDTFGPYLQADRKGRYEVSRLPTADDPMMLRLELIRERDDMFVDTLNEYYSDFYARMDTPYDDWRANSYTEQAAYDAINKKKWAKWIGGGLAIVGAILAPGDRRGADGDIRDIAVIAGAAAIQSGFKDSADSKIHKAALEELAESFGADVSGLVVDVDGRIIELKGSAEEQFQQWRALLREIAFTDVALPVDINVTAAPAPPAEVAPPASAEAEAWSPPSPEPVFVMPEGPAPPPPPTELQGTDTTATPSPGP
jgi:hypothetical protein